MCGYKGGYPLRPWSHTERCVPPSLSWSSSLPASHTTDASVFLHSLPHYLLSLHLSLLSLSLLLYLSSATLSLPFSLFSSSTAESPKEEQLYSIHLNLILFHFLLDFSAIQVRIKMEVRIRIPVRHKVTRTGGTVHYTVSMQVAKMMNSEAQERDF